MYKYLSSNILIPIILKQIFISYIFVDASGWVISDVSFGFMGGFRSCNIRPPRPKYPVGIDLTPTPILAANLRIHTRKKMTTEKALYIILQQPIRAKLFWWLLNLSFKNREVTLLLLFCHTDVVIRLFVHSSMYFFLFPPPPLFFTYLIKLNSLFELSACLIRTCLV